MAEVENDRGGRDNLNHPGMHESFLKPDQARTFFKPPPSDCLSLRGMLIPLNNRKRDGCGNKYGHFDALVVAVSNVPFALFHLRRARYSGHNIAASGVQAGRMRLEPLSRIGTASSRIAADAFAALPGLQMTRPSGRLNREQVSCNKNRQNAALLCERRSKGLCCGQVHRIQKVST
jgi:hypothetical protein